MKFNRLPIVCAAFLIVAMTIQFVMSYHREKVELEERIQYKMELAQKDFFFEVYDMHEATNEIRSPDCRRKPPISFRYPVSSSSAMVRTAR